jgi:hypothetical protein
MEPKGVGSALKSHHPSGHSQRRECPSEWWDLRAAPGAPGTTRVPVGP